MNAWKIASFLPFLQSFLYLAWYTTMSVLGHYNNFFFAAHLLDIAMGFKTLRTILSSVTHNGKQVLGLYLLGTMYRKGGKAVCKCMLSGKEFVLVWNASFLDKHLN